MSSFEVLVRCRPASPLGTQGTWSVERDAAAAGLQAIGATVCESNVSQQELYMGHVRPFLETCLCRQNCTIACHGAWKSGKSFTMGCLDADQMSLGSGRSGVISRAIMDVFQHVGPTAAVHVSVLEICNEEIVDLLAPKLRHRSGYSLRALLHASEVRSSKQQPVSVPAATAQEALQLVQRAMQLRSSTMSREHGPSSRGHCVVQLKWTYCASAPGPFTPNPLHCASAHTHQPFAPHTEQPTNADSSPGSGLGSGRPREGTLTLIDLASPSPVLSHEEGKAVRKGLLSLSKALSNVHRGEAFMSLRESKLTRVLTGSLQRVLLLACVGGPQPGSDDATLQMVRELLNPGGQDARLRAVVQRLGFSTGGGAPPAHSTTTPVAVRLSASGALHSAPVASLSSSGSSSSTAIPGAACASSRGPTGAAGVMTLKARASAMVLNLLHLRGHSHSHGGAVEAVEASEGSAAAMQNLRAHSASSGHQSSACAAAASASNAAARTVTTATAAAAAAPALSVAASKQHQEATSASPSGTAAELSADTSEHAAREISFTPATPPQPGAPLSTSSSTSPAKPQTAAVAFLSAQRTTSSPRPSGIPKPPPLPMPLASASPSPRHAEVTVVLPSQQPARRAATAASTPTATASSSVRASASRLPGGSMRSPRGPPAAASDVRRSAPGVTPTKVLPSRASVRRSQMLANPNLHVANWSSSTATASAGAAPAALDGGRHSAIPAAAAASPKPLATPSKIPRPTALVTPSSSSPRNGAKAGSSSSASPIATAATTPTASQPPQQPGRQPSFATSLSLSLTLSPPLTSPRDSACATTPSPASSTLSPLPIMRPRRVPMAMTNSGVPMTIMPSSALERVPPLPPLPPHQMHSFSLPSTSSVDLAGISLLGLTGMTNGRRQPRCSADLAGAEVEAASPTNLDRRSRSALPSHRHLLPSDPGVPKGPKARTLEAQYTRLLQDFNTFVTFARTTSGRLSRRATMDGDQQLNPADPATAADRTSAASACALTSAVAGAVAQSRVPELPAQLPGGPASPSRLPKAPAWSRSVSGIPKPQPVAVAAPATPPQQYSSPFGAAVAAAAAASSSSSSSSSYRRAVAPTAAKVAVASPRQRPGPAAPAAFSASKIGMGQQQVQQQQQQGTGGATLRARTTLSSSLSTALSSLKRCRSPATAPASRAAAASQSTAKPTTARSFTTSAAPPSVTRSASLPSGRLATRKSTPTVATAGLAAHQEAQQKLAARRAATMAALAAKRQQQEAAKAAESAGWAVPVVVMHGGGGSGAASAIPPAPSTSAAGGSGTTKDWSPFVPRQQLLRSRVMSPRGEAATAAATDADVATTPTKNSGSSSGAGKAQQGGRTSTSPCQPPTPDGFAPPKRRPTSDVAAAADATATATASIGQQLHTQRAAKASAVATPRTQKGASRSPSSVSGSSTPASPLRLEVLQVNNTRVLGLDESQLEDDDLFRMGCMQGGNAGALLGPGLLPEAAALLGLGSCSTPAAAAAGGCSQGQGQGRTVSAVASSAAEGSGSGSGDVDVELPDAFDCSASQGDSEMSCPALEAESVLLPAGAVLLPYVLFGSFPAAAPSAAALGFPAAAVADAGEIQPVRPPRSFMDLDLGFGSDDEDEEMEEGAEPSFAVAPAREGSPPAGDACVVGAHAQEASEEDDEDCFSLAIPIPPGTQPARALSSDEPQKRPAPATSCGGAGPQGANSPHSNSGGGVSSSRGSAHPSVTTSPLSSVTALFASSTPQAAAAAGRAGSGTSTTAGGRGFISHGGDGPKAQQALQLQLGGAPGSTGGSSGTSSSHLMAHSVSHHSCAMLDDDADVATEWSDDEDAMGGSGGDLATAGFASVPMDPPGAWWYDCTAAPKSDGLMLPIAAMMGSSAAWEAAVAEDVGAVAVVVRPAATAGWRPGAVSGGGGGLVVAAMPDPLPPAMLTHPSKAVAVAAAATAYPYVTPRKATRSHTYSSQAPARRPSIHSHELLLLTDELMASQAYPRTSAAPTRRSQLHPRGSLSSFPSAPNLRSSGATHPGTFRDLRRSASGGGCSVLLDSVDSAALLRAASSSSSSLQQPPLQQQQLPHPRLLRRATGPRVPAVAVGSSSQARRRTRASACGATAAAAMSTAPTTQQQVQLSHQSHITLLARLGSGSCLVDGAGGQAAAGRYTLLHTCSTNASVGQLCSVGASVDGDALLEEDVEGVQMLMDAEAAAAETAAAAAPAPPAISSSSAQSAVAGAAAAAAAHDATPPAAPTPGLPPSPAAAVVTPPTPPAISPSRDDGSEGGVASLMELAWNGTPWWGHSTDRWSRTLAQAQSGAKAHGVDEAAREAVGSNCSSSGAALHVPSGNVAAGAGSACSLMGMASGQQGRAGAAARQQQQQQQAAHPHPHPRGSGIFTLLASWTGLGWSAANEEGGVQRRLQQQQERQERQRVAARESPPPAVPPLRQATSPARGGSGGGAKRGGAGSKPRANSPTGMIMWAP